MTLLAVEVDDFVDASRTMFDRVGEPVRFAFGRLCTSLDATSAMAGDDPGGRDWAASYDRASRATAQATAQVVNAAYTTSSMFARSGLNYAEAESASTASGGSALVGALPPDVSIGAAPVPPSASGGGADTPTGWWLVEHTVGYVWPDGHQDKLHDAAAAWHASAAALDEAEFAPILASSVFARDRLPEADNVIAVCSGMRGHLLDLAAAHRSLGHACTSLANHIDDCHAAVKHELQELLSESVEIQIGGGLLSAVTFGLMEAPTQGAQLARVAAASTRIGALIEKFTAAARVVAEAFPGITAVSQQIRDTLEVLAGTPLAAAGVTSVPAITRTSRVAGSAGKGARLTRDAKAEIAATERIASESAGLPELSADAAQLEAKFKHAAVFGIAESRSAATLGRFRSRLIEFVREPDTIRKAGTYRGQSVILSYNPASRLVVIQTRDGTFLSGWRMSVKQLDYVIAKGSLGGT